MDQKNSMIYFANCLTNEFNSKEEREAYLLAERALEKQCAPAEVKRILRFWIRCPSCKRIILYKNYCYKCGQRLKYGTVVPLSCIIDTGNPTEKSNGEKEETDGENLD